MKKPKKQKKARRKVRKPEKASARGPFFAYDPLQHLEQEDRLALATALATGSRKQFQEHLKAQLEIAETISPLHILSMLAYYALMAPVTVAAAAGNRPRPGTRVQQGQAEFFQALLLRNPLKDYTPPDPSLSERVFEGLPSLFDAHGMMQLPFDGKPDSDADKEKSAVRLVQSYLRNHTAGVRN